jgi:predicted nucleotidyltransferase
MVTASVTRREYPIPIPYEAIAEFCRRNHIRKLSLFGSILRDDFTPESDVDVLVEFEEGRTPGLSFFDLPHELSALLGRTTDLLTPASLSKYFRDGVLAEAEPIYVTT